MAENKTQRTASSPQAFVKRIADEQRRRDCLEMIGVMQEITGHPPKMWGTSIVGFDQYHYKYESGREGDILLTGFSPRKQDLVLYLGEDGLGTKGLLAKLGKHKAGKAGDRAQLPDVPFQMLTSLELDTNAWCDIARRASWQATRMNLNTFARHGVFAQRELVDIVAARLRDESEIRRARVFPYQLLAAFRSVDGAVPDSIRRALEDAMETAIANLPSIDGQVYVCPDVSGSMRWPLTGVRRGATTTMRCVDVAALVSAAVLRRNPDAEVLPFDDGVVSLRLSPRDSVMTNAERLAAVGGGGTRVSAPLALLNLRKASGDLVIVVSDNESWVDASSGRGTATMREWNRFRARNPRARLVLIDLQPYSTTQASERSDILNVGGFSDQVFDIVADFAAGRLNADHWVGKIEAIAV